MQATDPQKTAVFGTPEMRSAGTPNPSVRITSSEGAPRKMSTYATAAARAGKKTGLRPLRITASISPTIRTIRLGDHEDLEVELESLQYLGEGRLEIGPAEEGLAHRFPPR